MTLELARWQFALVTIFHFFFVPVTIGLGLLVAIMQTKAYRNHDEGWERLTRFFGRLFLINIAVGVVTGIVLEFQFGLNWSSYSIFVGNIFGAPLAIEGLLAFFLESTFVGLWIFGRGRLSPRVHLATIWLTSLGTILSALFILGANAWMQHPVGYKVVNGQAVLTNFWAVLGNSTLWWSFAHTVLAAFVTAGMLVLGISVWRAHREKVDGALRESFLKAARFAAAFTLVAVILTCVAGDAQARLMDTQQPMKMAAAEALYQTKDGASFSLLTIGNLKGNPVFQIRVPHLLSLIADLSWNGQVSGINAGPGRRGGEVRGRELRAGDLVDVLVVPGDGRGRRTADLALRMGDVARAAQPDARQPVVPQSRAHRHGAPVPGQPHGVDLHRGRPPTMDRVRADEDRERRVPGDDDRRRGHPRRIRAHLRGARRGRRGPDGSRGPPAARRARGNRFGRQRLRRPESRVLRGRSWCPSQI